MLYFSTAWLTAGAPNLAAAREWMDAVEDRALLWPGSLGYAPHRLGLPFDMDVPDGEEFLLLLEEGSEKDGDWFARMADHLGHEGRAEYLRLAREVALGILERLAREGMDAGDLDIVSMANGRLVTAGNDPYNDRHVWFRRVESLRHTYHPDLAAAAGVVFLHDVGHNTRLEVTE